MRILCHSPRCVYVVLIGERVVIRVCDGSCRIGGLQRIESLVIVAASMDIGKNCRVSGHDESKHGGKERGGTNISLRLYPITSCLFSRIPHVNESVRSVIPKPA